MNAKTIVITGCSTGFGRVTALQLAEHGWRVVATVRREADRLDLLAEAAARNVSERLLVVLCDITLPADVARLAQSVHEMASGLDALLNNAGTGYGGPLELLPLADVQAQLEVNLYGHLAVTQALLPDLKAARGTLINVSSIGGWLAFPLYGPYHMSKFALNAMSEVLRLELAPFGVKVVIVAPAASPTPIWETGLRRIHASSVFSNMGDYARLADAMERRARQTAASGFPPELFARTVLRILNSRRPASLTYVPAWAGLMVAGRRLLPDWLWDWGVRRVLGW